MKRLFSGRLRLLTLIAAIVGIALTNVIGAGAATLCVNPGGTGPCFASIQAAITAATDGDTINVEAGTYTEDLQINKQVTLLGPNADIDPNTGTRGAEAIIAGGAGQAVVPKVPNIVINGFKITADSTAQAIYTDDGDANPAVGVPGLTISNNILVGGSRSVTVATKGDDVSILHNTMSGVAFDINIVGDHARLKIDDNVLNGPVSSSAIMMNLGSADDAFELKNNKVFDLVNISADITNAVVSGNTFDAHSASTLDVQIALHTNSTVSGNTFVGGTSTACLQLFGTQFGIVPSDGVTVSSNTFTDCGANGASSNYAVQLSQGVDNVTISGNTITNAYEALNTRTDLGWTLNSNIHFNGNFVTGTRHVGANNTVTGTLDASANWWGSIGGPGTSAGVTLKPWCTDSGCATKSDNANLTALSLSSGMNGTFDSATTAYSAGVDNGTSSVTVNATPSPGATTAISGNSGLVVGANAVTVLVTSEDGTATKTYTVTVTRAAPDTPTGTTATTATALPVTTATLTQADGTVSETTTVDRPGTILTSSASISWAPGTFGTDTTVPLVVRVQPLAVGTQNTTSSFRVSQQAVQITADLGGSRVTQLSGVLEIVFSNPGKGFVPSYAPDGATWTNIALLSSTVLPAGQAEGYYIDAGNLIHVLTRHLTYFRLKDVQAPSRVTLSATVDKKYLRLVLRGASDNAGVTGYVVSRNGHRYRTTTRTYVALPRLAGRYSVVAVDRAGNVSQRSATVTLVRTHDSRHPYAISTG